MSQRDWNVASRWGGLAAVAMLLGLCFILLGWQTISASPSTFHVAPGGDCGGAANCYGTIQVAVDAADDGDTIKVAQGTYTSTGAEVVYIDSAITLIGGYAITDWDQSDPETRPTIIDAEDAYRRGVYIDGSGMPTITLKGLTVQGGAPEDLDGAGIYVQNALLVMQDSIVRDNWNVEGAGGGGLYARDSTLILTGNTFQGNNAAGGGGMRVEGSSNVTIRGNTFRGNDAFSGGGLLLGGSTVAIVRENTFQGNFGGEAGGIWVHDNAFVTLSGNTIVSNTTAIDMSRPGGGLLVDGGTVVAMGNHFEENSAFDGAGIYVDNPDGSVTLSGNIIVSNHASTDGGRGGGLFVQRGTVLVQGNTIEGNNAAGGGGIDVNGGTMTLRSNQMLSNSAFFGGGLSVEGSAVVHLTGNTFRDNFGGHGGGLLMGSGTVQMSGNAFHDNDSNPDQGPSLLIEGGTVDAQNDIIADSAEPDGAAVSVWGGTLTARHWSLVNNGSYALETDGGSAVLTNTLVVSHTLGGLWGAGTVADTTLFYNSAATCGGGATCTNNLSGDPKFRSGATGDYHIDSGSAAIDAGVDAGVYVDLDGNPRPADAGFDIGADEFGHWVFLPLTVRNHSGTRQQFR